MQKLHVVGFTTEHDGLILATRKGAKSGGYVVALDDTTLATISEATRLRNGDASAAAAEGGRHLPAVVTPPAKPTSALSPRDIQARLRAGASVPEVAAAAGVDEEWILRFATPIRAEQARVVDRALRLPCLRARAGLSAEPLGAAVQANLAARGIRLHDDLFADAWTAYNLHGTTWAVRFAYVHRSRAKVAVWQVDLRSGEVTTRGRLAADLGYVEPGRRPPPLEPLEPEPTPVPAPPATPAGPTRARGQGGAGRAGVAAASKRAGAPSKRPSPPPTPPADERPTHLARPPSPMNSTNRVPNQPGRMAGAPSLRPAPPRRPPAARRPEPAPEPEPEAPRSPEPPPGTGAAPEAPARAFTPQPPPAKPARPAPRRPGRSAPARPVPTIPAMAPPGVIEVGEDEAEPAVVVLPAPPARRAR